MTRLSRKSRDRSRAIALSLRLYHFCLRAYPQQFRHTYGERMMRVFRDHCRAIAEQHGVLSLIPLWLHTFSDLIYTAGLERWQVFKEKNAMVTSRYPQQFSLRLWFALTATIIAFVVSLVASLNLYLLEDANPLTQAAYSTSSVLRFSYDVVYLSALAAGVAVCAIVGYALVQRTALVTTGLLIVMLLVAFAGFGGMLVRHVSTFLILLLIFSALTLISLLTGHVATTRALRFLGQRPAAVLGACVSVSCVLLINVVALVLHTLLLNPVSHALYMQGQIGDTHLNFSLIAMGIALLALIGCAISLGFALHSPSRQSS
jgi:hypothetical protein